MKKHGVVVNMPDFSYAVTTERAERNSSVDLRGALTPVRVKHHASITEPKSIGALLRSIYGFSGSYITKCALQLAPLIFMLAGALLHAEWIEIVFDKNDWFFNNSISNLHVMTSSNST